MTEPTPFSLQPPLFPLERWSRIAGVCGTLLLISLVGFGVVSPMHGGFREVTGLPCPLCGGTRATRAILAGDWSRAVYLNILAFPALLSAILILSVLTIEAIRGRALANYKVLVRRVPKWTPIAALIILAIYLSQLYLAVKMPKNELVDFTNPIAAALRDVLK